MHQQAWSTRSQTCQVFYENVKVFPWKLTEVPWKSMVGSDVFPTELVPFLGNMLVFTGVVIAICGWLLFFGFDSFCFGSLRQQKFGWDLFQKSPPSLCGLMSSDFEKQRNLFYQTERTRNCLWFSWKSQGSPSNATPTPRKSIKPYEG